jgi:imidazolonepropionase-like amidohydrolase
VLTADVVKLINEGGVYLVMNPYLMESVDVSKFQPLTRKKHEEERRLSEASLQLAVKAGVKMAFGTDAGSIPHGDNARQFSSLVKWGVKPLEAIRMATVHAASLLGFEDRGVIAEGKVADLVAVRGNPLHDIRVLEEIKFVMRSGVVHKHDK